MTAHLPPPNDNLWHRVDVENASSPIVNLILNNLSVWSIGSGLLGGGLIWLAAELFGFHVLRHNTTAWWHVFVLLGDILVVIVIHELCHMLFARWSESRFIFIGGDLAPATQIGGTYTKVRYVFCILAPTLLISPLGIMLAEYLDSPPLMLMVIGNCAGSGRDWCMALVVYLIVPGDLLYADGDQLYQLSANRSGVQEVNG